MKKKFSLLLLTISITITGVCQNFQPVNQSNDSLDFSAFLQGVKYAYIISDDTGVKKITDGETHADASAILGITDYLKAIGFNDVKWGSISNMPKDYPSLCDLVLVSPTWQFERSAFTNIKLKFISCNGDTFEFESNKNISTIFADIRTSFYNRCLEMYGNRRNYDSSQRLKLPYNMTEWSEEKLKRNFKGNGANSIEGIYESAFDTPSMPKYKFGLIKSDDGYNLIYLGGGKNYLDWLVGEIKAKLIPTASATLFKAEWKMGNKQINENTYISFETGSMNLFMENKDKSVYIKLFPTVNDNINANTNANTTEQSSGTGFGITSDGLIVTNSHVINGATKISVRGINNDFSTSLAAKIVIEDKNNDLAIIKIVDPKFNSLGTMPYTIPTKSSDVGSQVFVLGYPLKAMMGEEIKLTNGIISSKSGYQGDVTSYQISAPLQPGNSGGPLFDDNGNLIGIVNAKLTVGENVSYAIKSAYLTNLFDLLPSAPKLATVNLLARKKLTEQVKLINKFVFIIEVN
jgi:S1-C subfamily serine protease